MKGYTCCIDLQELGKAVESLSSVDSCISKNNITNIFFDIDNMLKKINFEHGRCFSSFSSTFEYIEDEVDSISKELFQLNYALQKTIIISRQSDKKTIQDLQEISSYYGDEQANNTVQNLLMDPKIVLADNKNDFEKDMDPFIRVITDSNIEEEALPYTMNDINSLPLGISIALTGATSSVGAAMIHSIRRNEKNNKEENIPFSLGINKNIWEDPVPFYAKKDLDEKKENYPINFEALEDIDI